MPPRLSKNHARFNRLCPSVLRRTLRSLRPSLRGGVFVVPRGRRPIDFRRPHPSPRRAYCFVNLQSLPLARFSRCWIIHQHQRTGVFFTRTAHAAGRWGRVFPGCLVFCVFAFFKFRRRAFFVFCGSTLKIIPFIRTDAIAIDKKIRGSKFLPRKTASKKIFLSRIFTLRFSIRLFVAWFPTL